MRILFLSYWELNDGLTKSTVLPHLRILARIPEIESIVYCSIERTIRSVSPLSLDSKVIHVPLFTGKSYLHKVLDFIKLPLRLVRLLRTYEIDIMICRGAPSGSLGYLAHKRSGIRYVVESFEPHAQYMAESGVWKSYGLRYFFQCKWEKAQIDTAFMISTVSENYRNHLIQGGMDRKKVFAVPCAVEIGKFSLDLVKRSQMRKRLKFEDSCIVGIYTGKFGGLYYDDEAFQIFGVAFQCIRDFRLIILTPDNQQIVTSRLMDAGIAPEKVVVGHVDHEMVPQYLSAADLAFALYKPSPSKRYLSPVKVGEYWANGLPVLLTKGVGDDGEIIQNEGGGAEFSLAEQDSLSGALYSLEKIIRNNEREKNASHIIPLAIKHRDFKRVEEFYGALFLASQINSNLPDESVTCR